MLSHRPSDLVARAASYPIELARRFPINPSLDNSGAPSGYELLAFLLDANTAVPTIYHLSLF